jgi:hypothetical protein
MNTQGYFVPYLRRRVTIVAGQGGGYVVRPKMAIIAVGHLHLQLSFHVAVQAHSHGAVFLARHRVKAVTYAAMAIAAVHIARYARLNRVDDQAMWHAKPVTRDLARDLLVANETLLRILGAHVGDKVLVSSCLLLRFAVASVASNATQPAVRSHDRFWFDQIGLGRIQFRSAGLKSLKRKMAGLAATGPALSVGNCGQGGCGNRLDRTECIRGRLQYQPEHDGQHRQA